MTELLSFITNNSIVIIPFGVIILLLIFVLIGVALTKTAAYFVERFPREEKDQVEYYSYKAKAAELKSEVDAYNEAIDRLRQEYENAIKEYVISKMPNKELSNLILLARKIVDEDLRSYKQLNQREEIDDTEVEYESIEDEILHMNTYETYLGVINMEEPGRNAGRVV